MPLALLVAVLHLQDDKDDLNTPFGDSESDYVVAIKLADELDSLLPKEDGPATAGPWISVIQILLPILFDLLKDEK